MIPDDHQLETISQLRAGSLAEVPFAVLLYALSVYRRSGVLEIERPPLKKSIVIENGVPVDCRSNLLHETLSRFMVARGDLTEEVGQECLNKSIARGLRFGEVLILEGLITASDLYRVLQQNLAKKLLDFFTWRSGEFRLRDELPKVESTLKVNAAQLVVTGIAKFALDDEVNEAVAPLVGTELFLHPSPPCSLTDIRLTSAQRQLTELLYGGKRLDELAAETTIPFNQIMRLLYALAVIGIVVPQERLPTEPPPAEPAFDGVETIPFPTIGLEAAASEPEPAPPSLASRRPASRPPAKSPASEPSASEPSASEPSASEPSASEPSASEPPASPKITDEERDALMEAFLNHRKQDAFELLGAQEDASMVDIEERFLDFSQRFAPWRFAAATQGLVEKAEDLFLAGGRAFGELCDRERRNALIARRRNLRSGKAKQPARDRFLIKSELLDAELQFKKGKALMQAGRYREASQQLEFASDCDPQNSTYRSELAYCRFFAAAGTGPEGLAKRGSRQAAPRLAAAGERSLEELRETLRIDPGSGLAAYYMGMIQGEIGLFEEAEKNLRRSIKVLMPDRRPIQALKELQAKQKKRKKLGLF